MSIYKFTVTLCLIQSALWYLFAKVREIFSLSIFENDQEFDICSS